MYYFILHLSLADLLTAFLTLLPEVVWTFTRDRFYETTRIFDLIFDKVTPRNNIFMFI
jgi:hypothetical protein